MRPDKCHQPIGVFGATMTLVGLVIGVSIFILPGLLAATAGPAVVFSYTFAAILAAFACLVAAQIGSAFPVSGASFVAVSRLVSPFWGFMIVWMVLGGISVAIALLSFGFADFSSLIWPSLNRGVTAIVLIAALTGLNVMGVRETVWAQTLMVFAFILALAIFCTAAFGQMDKELLSPFFPNGMRPVVAASVPAFFSFAGFMTIIELGGEVKNPAKTLPVALLFSFFVVLGAYVSVAIAVAGVIPWQELAGQEVSVGHAAMIVLPDWLAKAVTLTALAAAASSVNVLLFGYSRDVLALAREGFLPRFMGRVSRSNNEPVAGVLLIAGLSMIAVAFGAGVIQYATLTVVALMLLQILVGIAAIRLPRKDAVLYEGLGFKIHRRLLTVCAACLIALSSVFMLVAALDSPRSTSAATVFFLSGVGFFLLRSSRK